MAKNISSLHQADSNRERDCILKTKNVLLDYSKTFIDKESFSNLEKKLAEKQFEKKREQLFKGEYLNKSENRLVFHTGLRDSNSNHSFAKDINSVKAKIKDFSDKFAKGQLLGSSGKSIKYVVNIGIGGSSLGPKLVVESIADKETLSRFYFVSNVDFVLIDQILKTIPIKETLFVIASKTFTTYETFLNADYVKSIYQKQNLDPNKHFVAISANTTQAIKWGVPEDRIFPFWEWVGGRYSIWSAIGLPIALAFGYEQYDKFIKGAEEIDIHFRTAKNSENIPLLLAFNSYLNTQEEGLTDEVITAYSDRLYNLPEYLQQLQMESNGKNIKTDGSALDSNQKTCPAIWGGIGTNVQHAFYQWLHQGTGKVSVEFIGIKEKNEGDFEFASISNLLAQSSALAFGRSEEEYKQINPNDENLAYKKFPGNVPNILLLFNSPSIENIGKLIAIYEHKTFALGVMNDINSYDQWGVELGKEYAKKFLKEFSSEKSPHEIINEWKKF